MGRGGGQNGDKEIERGIGGQIKKGERTRMGVWETGWRDSEQYKKASVIGTALKSLLSPPLLTFTISR